MLAQVDRRISPGTYRKSQIGIATLHQLMRPRAHTTLLLAVQLQRT
jgi:hypothetical protein